MRDFGLLLVMVGVFVLVSCHSLKRSQVAEAPRIVLVTPNLDDDDGDGKPDAEDGIINGPEDRADLTIVELPMPVSECVPVIEGPGAELYRILEVRGNGGEKTQVLMEAVAPRSLHSAAVLQSGPNTIPGTSSRLNIKPFLLTCSLDPVSEVFACNKPESLPLVEQLQEVFAEIPEPPRLTLLESKIDGQGIDRWAQDSTEIGHFYDTTIDAAIAGLRANHAYDPKTHPKHLDQIFRDIFQGRDRCSLKIGESRPEGKYIDWMGNLESTPACIGPDGRNYPMGRVVTGKQNGMSLNAAVLEFLEAQGVQWPPIVLDTSFLWIGHVDEIVNFCPTSNGFKALVVSPTLGRKLLEDLARQGHGDSVILEGKKYPNRSWETTVAKVLNDAEIMKINDTAAKIMATNRELLKREMSLDEKDIIDLPVVFFRTQGIPLWPNPVNGLMIDNHYIVSCPHGPIVNGKDMIEQSYRTAFAGTDLVLHFIDVFEGYSQNGGDIHCGTNAIRHRAPSSGLSNRM